MDKLEALRNLHAEASIKAFGLSNNPLGLYHLAVVRAAAELIAENDKGASALSGLKVAKPVVVQWTIKSILSLLVQEELVSDAVVTQLLSQKHSGFSVWLGEPFEDQESSQFVARYILLRQGSGGTGRAWFSLAAKAHHRA